MSFECPICLEEFNIKSPDHIPKIIKCGDTLCSKCLKNFYQNGKINCPVCKKTINEIIEDVRTNNYALNNNNKIICELCLKEYTSSFKSEKTPKTLKCGDTLCLDCLKKHYKKNQIVCPFCRKKNKEKLDEIPVNKCAIELVEKELLNNKNYLNDDSIINNKEFDYEFSIGLMGDSGVGKTSIVHYFYKGEPADNLASTVGFEFHFKYLLIDGKKIKIRLWDTAGQECYRSLAAGMLRGVHAALLVFSLANPYVPNEGDFDKDSNKLYYEWKNSDDDKKKMIEKDLTEKTFGQIKSWLNQYNDFNQEKNRLVYLIGNKVDDVENRVINKDEMQSFAEKHSLKYIETSAITGENIDKIFRELSLDLMEIPECGRVTIKLDKNYKKKKGKCKC